MDSKHDVGPHLLTNIYGEIVEQEAICVEVFSGSHRREDTG